MSNEASFSQALHWHKLGQFEQALGEYQAVLAQYPNHPESLYNMATLYGQTGSWHTAISYFEQALSSAPESPEILFNLSIAYLNCEQFGAAIHNLEKTIQKSTEHGPAHHLLGVLLFKTGHHDRARDAFELALQYDMDEAQVCLNYAVLELDQEDLAKAKALLQQAVDSDESCEDAWYNLGVVLDLQGDLHGATTALQKVTKASEHYFAAQHRLAFVFKSLGDAQQALHSCQKALSLKNDESLAYLQQVLSSEVISEIPLNYIQTLFDHYAPSYEKHLTDVLKCDIPHKMMRFLLEKPRVISWRQCEVLDVGVGSGLFGSVLPESPARLVGVDCSEKMLEQADRRKLYDELVLQDINSYLEQTEELFDLIAMCDVMPYYCSAEDVFRLVQSRLKDNGLFLLSIEVLKDPENKYQIHESLRCQHSKSYILEVAAEAGFSCLEQQDLPLREQDGHPVSGSVFLLKNKL